MGELQTDFILIFVTVNDSKFGQQLGTYLSNLKSMGFVLETVISETLQGKEFIKVQMRLDTAISLAGTYKIGLACKNPYHEPEPVTVPCLRFLDNELTTRNPSLVIASRNKESVKGQKPEKPTSAERIMIVYEALRVAKFSEQPYEFGVEEMKKEGIIEAGYPIHDGQWKWTTTGLLNDRQLLNAYWSNLFVFYKIQPTELIQKYFGPEAGFFYTQLGLYMALLAPAAIFGLISILANNLKNDPRLIQICKSKLYTCPYCLSPQYCNFNFLESSCHYSKFNFKFDNDSTMPFSVLMSFWGIIFIALWERKQSFLKVAWNIPHYLRPDLLTRPSYYKKMIKPLNKTKDDFSKSKSRRIRFWGTFKLTMANFYGNLKNGFFTKSRPTKQSNNAKTKRTTETEKPEKYVEKSKSRVSRGKIATALKKPENKNEKDLEYLTKRQQFAPLKYLLIGVIIVGFLEFLILTCIILFRISLAEKIASSNSKTSPEGVKINNRSSAIIFTARITAVLGTAIIIAFDFGIDYFALYLTKKENPKTQREFDRSYTIKLVVLSFINNFTIPIYLGLFRGINFTYPGDKKMWQFFAGVNADFCDVSGCLADVWIFIAMVIPMKSLFNFCKNVMFPIVYKKLTETSRLFTNDEHAQWEMDRDLTPLPRYYFTKLNKDFIIQYGYVVFFSSSFTLLPLIVLTLNIIELRVHAMMLVRFFQRFVPRQSCERDIWKKILYIVTTFAVFVNALILGTTLNWAERHYYKKYVDKNLNGYIDASVSKFTVEDYGKIVNGDKITECYYVGRRVGKETENNFRKYQYSDLHYQTYCAKFIFTVGLMVSCIIFGMIFRFATSPPHYLQERKIHQEKTHPK